MTAIAHAELADTPTGVLEALRERQTVANQAEVHKLQLAIRWAIMHPVESIDRAAATVPGTEDELAIAGEGAPLVAEFCVADLSLALNVSTDSARRLLGDAIELRYRLPRLWGRVLAGTVPVWKARRVAQATTTLGRDAALHVDRHLAPVIERCSFAQIEGVSDLLCKRWAVTLALAA
jgi:hypothetical protein